MRTCTLRLETEEEPADEVDIAAAGLAPPELFLAFDMSHTSGHNFRK